MLTAFSLALEKGHAVGIPTKIWWMTKWINSSHLNNLCITGLYTEVALTWNKTPSLMTNEHAETISECLPMLSCLKWQGRAVLWCGSYGRLHYDFTFCDLKKLLDLSLPESPQKLYLTHRAIVRITWYTMCNMLKTGLGTFFSFMLPFFFFF